MLQIARVSNINRKLQFIMLHNVKSIDNERRCRVNSRPVRFEGFPFFDLA